MSDGTTWLGTITWLASEKKTLDRLNLTLAFLWRHCRGNRQPVNHFIMNVSGIVGELSLCVNNQESEYLFNVNAYESEYSKIDESGKISSSVNLVL